MRCWIIGSKRWGKTEEEQYEVEWQETHPRYASMTQAERDDFDPAQHPIKIREFPITGDRAAALARAKAFAESKIADSHFGVVTVTHQYLEEIDGQNWDWENGEAIYVDEPAETRGAP